MIEASRAIHALYRLSPAHLQGDRPLAGTVSRAPLVNWGVFSHRAWRLASACVVAAAFSACSSGDTTGDGGLANGGGSGGGGGGLVQVDECDVPEDCQADLEESDFDPTCVEVTCEDNQCRFRGSSLDGQGCDDGSECTLNDVCDNRYCVGSGEVDCDDGDDCTLDTCDADTGDCDHAIAVGQICDDEIACTDTDICNDSGVCQGSPTETCECTENDDCADQSPENKCEGIFVCQANYSCAFDPTTAVKCDDWTGDCTTGECVPETGECVGNPVNEGANCTDDDPCHAPDTGTCLDGGCVDAEGVDCDDEDPCTIDACDSATGECVHTVEQGADCDDDNACTTGDTCLPDGTCFGTEVSCDDDELCTEDSCETTTGECIYTPTEGECNDTDPCTVDDACLEGQCQGTPKDCDDGNTCTDDICANTGSCIHSAKPDDPQTLCDLNDPCSAGDFCQSGQCTSGESLCECAADEDCAAYNSDDPCSPDYFCQTEIMPKSCQPDSSTVPQCEESDVPCMLNTCVSETGECAMIEASDGLGCDDGDPCSLDGFCYDGSCATTPIDCEDGYPCTANLCLDAGCYTQELTEGDKLLDISFDAGFPDGWTQESDHEEVYWALSGAYAEGEGGLGMVVTGPDGSYDGPVEAWLRSPKFHVYGEELELRYKVKTEMAQSGCGTDVLRVGIEAYGLFTPLQVICQTQSEWTDMWLDLSEYRNQRVQLVFLFVANDIQNAGFGAAIDGIEIDALFSCVDDDVCTTGETCLLGTCDLVVDTCDDGDGCTLDSCDPATGCVHEPQDECLCEIASDCPLLGNCAVPTCIDGICGATHIEGDCDTGDLCAINGTCLGGVCVGETPECDDDNACTTNLCDSQVGCLYTPNEDGCDDGDLCTEGDQCVDGTCTGTPKDCASGNPCALSSCIGGECYAEPLHHGQVQVGDDFDGVAAIDLPPDWLQESSDPAWTWAVNTVSSVSPPNAITATGPTEWSDAPVVLRLDTPHFTIPTHGATLNFMLSMALGDDTCDTDTLTIFVGGEEVHVACESTASFVEVSIPLEASDGAVSARFELALAGDTAAGVDVRLDDVELLANYMCAEDDACLEGLCVVGNCVTEPVPNCP